mgnify:CR=1 FL=1
MVSHKLGKNLRFGKWNNLLCLNLVKYTSKQLKLLLRSTTQLGKYGRSLKSGLLTRLRKKNWIQLSVKLAKKLC